MTTNQPTVTTDLFLLMSKDDGRPEAFGQQTGFGLAGALLTDLVIADRLGVSDDGKKLRVLSTAPTGDALLDEGLRRWEGKDGKALGSAVTGASRQKLERVVGDYLAERGVVRVEEGGYLGLKPWRYPAVDGAHEAEVRRGLVEVLRGATPTVEQHALIGLLHGLQLASKVLGEEETGLSKGDVKRRVKEIARTAGPGAEGVTKAVQSLNAAIVAAAIVPAATS